MKTTLLVLALCGVALAKVDIRRIYVKPNTPNHGVIAPRIIGGQEAKPHSIPYQVWLTVTGEEDGETVQWLCGGSLISENYVLTAGHCGYQATSAVVLLGAHNITDKNEKTQVKINSKNIIVHEKFDMDNIRNDIAVIELATKAQLNDNIKLVTLPSLSDAGETYAGVTAKVSGWGLTDGFGTSVSPVLMYVESDIITNAECEKVFDIIEDTEVCLNGKNGKSSCNGDSGGPLTTGGKQIGIVSFGVIYCQSGFPSAFTRVTSYLKWIGENTDVKIQ